MELKQLRFFLRVAELGSFVQAAASLAITQPVLRRHVKCLEEECGEVLFKRRGRSMVLSSSGELLAVNAREMLEISEVIVSDLTARRVEPSGGVIIVMPPSVGWVFTVPLVQGCQLRHPGLSLQVMESSGGQVLEWVATGRADIGIVYTLPSNPNLRMEPLVEEDLVLLGPLTDPGTLGQDAVAPYRLATLPLIMPAHPHDLRTYVDRRMARHGLTLRIEHEMDSMASTLALVEAGVGYTIVCYAAARPCVEAGLFRWWRVKEPRMSLQLMLVTAAQRPKTAAVRLMLELIHDQVRDLSWVSPPDPLSI